MPAPNPLIAPATGIVSQQLNTTEADKVVVYVTTALGLGETVDILIPTTNAGLTPLYDPLIAGPNQLTSTSPSAVLEGGVLYTIRKNATIGATGVDYQLKPRSAGV